MNRPIDPLSLRHFVAVCEEGNIARAAARESLVPSALSKRLSALEADMGVPLLSRLRRGVQATPAGQALLVHARDVLAGLDRLRAEVSGYGQGVQGSVRILASPSALAEFLPEDIAGFLAQHPGIRINLEERMSVDIVRDVLAGSADLGVLWDRMIDLSGLRTLPYRQDQLCVAMGPGHALANHTRLKLTDLLGEPTINVSPGGQMDQLLRRQAALAGVVPVYRMQVSSMDAACRLVVAGLGLTILPREAVRAHAHSGQLRLIQLDEPWALRKFVLVTRGPEVVAASTQLLLAHLQQVAHLADSEPRSA